MTTEHNESALKKEYKMFHDTWEPIKQQIREKLDIDKIDIPSPGLASTILVDHLVNHDDIEARKKAEFEKTVKMADCADVDILYLCVQRMLDLFEVINYSPAAVWLGIFYEEVLEKYKDAQNWYNKAAQHKNGMGMYRVGLLYLFEKVEIPSQVSLIRCFTDAIDNGVPAAQTIIDEYFDENGVCKKNLIRV